MDTYVQHPKFQRKCQPYSCKVNYPMGCHTQKDLMFKSKTCRPFGYQPKRQNPGGLKFYQYDYTVQTEYGHPLNHPGRGWQYYERTGRFPQ